MSKKQIRTSDIKDLCFDFVELLREKILDEDFRESVTPDDFYNLVGSIKQILDVCLKCEE